MNWSAFKAWAQQPTTIHFFGVVAMAIVGTLSHFLGANQEWAAGLGLVSYALVHAGINDNSSSKSIEALMTDAFNGYVQNKMAGVLPALIADGPAVIASLASVNVGSPAVSASGDIAPATAPIPVSVIGMNK